MKSILLNLFLTFFSFLVLFIFIEIGFRLLPSKPSDTKSWNDRPSFYFDPEGSIDHRGMNHSAVKPKDTFRIAVVGDSYSFGPFMQYTDTFAYKLGQLLNQNNTTPKVEVINYGISGYSTSHEVELVEKALSEEADLIILQVTLNDTEVKPFRPKGVIIATNKYGEVTITPEMNPIISKSKFLSFIATRVYAYKSKFSYQDYFYSLYDERNEKGVNLFKTSIASMKNLTSNKKVPIMGVLFPLFGVTIDKSYPFTGIHEKIKDIFNKEEIKIVDITDSYTNIPTLRLQVIPGVDFHPNEIGHRIAAESIYSSLIESSLVPMSSKIRHTYKNRNHLKREAADN